MLIGDYLPKMCSVTIPTIKSYAEKIGAEFKILTDRKFPNWNIMYEKFQIHELGKDADWNFYFDADIILHPRMPDLSEFLHPFCVGCFYAFATPSNYPLNIYFQRNCRNVVLAGSMIMSSRFTHEIWEPFEESVENIYKTIKPIDEYRMAMNLARYNLNYAGLNIPETVGKFFHLEITSNNEQSDQTGIDLAYRYMKANDML